MTDANNPMAIAMQSNAMWIAVNVTLVLVAERKAMRVYRPKLSLDYSSTLHITSAPACMPDSTQESRIFCEIRGLTELF